MVTISIETMGDLKDKPITEELSYELMMRIIFFLFLITGLEQFYWRLNIQRVQMVLWRIVKGFVDMPSHTIPPALVWRL